MTSEATSIFEDATAKTPTPAAKEETPKEQVTSTNNGNENENGNKEEKDKNETNTENNDGNNEEKGGSELRNRGKNVKSGKGDAAIIPKLQENISVIGASIGDSLTKSTAKILDSYDDVLKTVGSSTGIQFAPVKIPLARRRQTLAVLMQSIAFFLAIFLNFLAWRYWTGIKFYLYLLYLCWKLMYQTFHKDGGLPIPWFRSLTFWKWFNDFFPVTLHKTCDLSKKEDKSYIFGYHPHGIIGMGAWASFASVGASGFAKLFPNVDVRLLTLRLNFFIPFFDLYLTFMGVCDASRESCNAILSSPDKKSLALVLGGAKESLDAHPGKVVLFLRDRKGFVKIALEHGASLVPVFGFGENELFVQMENPQGSLLRRIQDQLQQRLGFALPIFRGRGVFQYNFGLLPRRIPIHVLFGEPIDCPKIRRSEITSDILNKYHALYMIKLKELFDNNKSQFYTNGPPPELQFR